MDKIVLLGCGGHAKSVADAILQGNSYEIAGFIDAMKNEEFVYRGIRVIGCDDDLQALYNMGIHHACICVGYLGHGNIRNILYENLKSIGFTLPVIIDPSTVLAADVNVGEGSFIGKGAIVNANASIGKMCIINSGAIIEHDCIVDDFSHISVASILCGGVNVGRASFIGANSTVIQEKTIGQNCIIGAGTVVRKNVADYNIICCKDKMIICRKT